MNFNYCFGNDCYKYFDKTGLQLTEYQIMAPEQSQPGQPAMEYLMDPLPIFDNPNYKGNGKLKDKVAIITGAEDRKSVV